MLPQATHQVPVTRSKHEKTKSNKNQATGAQSTLVSASDIAAKAPEATASAPESTGALLATSTPVSTQTPPHVDDSRSAGVHVMDTSARYAAGNDAGGITPTGNRSLPVRGWP
jgi:hypothetical protein